MKKIIFIVFSIICLFVFFTGLTYADEISDLQKKIAEYEAQISNLNKQALSLSQQIKLMDSQISLTTLKISESEAKIQSLEKEILLLSDKIERLDVSLNSVSKMLLARVTETYKKGKLDAISLLFSSKSFSEFMTSYRYLQSVQAFDRQMLINMEQTKTNYDEQKKLKEKIQKDLENLKVVLINQKKQLALQVVDRKRLLEETKGKEAEFQKLLQATKQELEAIQKIIAGGGQEAEAGKISEGERIAGIIQGASACSTGTHLHFEVRDNGELKNPFSMLRNISLTDYSGGDEHTGQGSWSWPLSEPVMLTQGYGSNTSAIRSKLVWYNFHTGIDLYSQDKTIKAVRPGTLFRGGVACGKGTLRYVRLRHEGSSIDTYYLHVDY